MEYRQNFTILGHRGCIGVDGIGENTIPAFERALRDGADGIELDVYAIPDIDNVWTGAPQETVDNANLHVAQIFGMGADGAFANNPGGVSRL